MENAVKIYTAKYRYHAFGATDVVICVVVANSEGEALAMAKQAYGGVDTDWDIREIEAKEHGIEVCLFNRCFEER